MSMFWTGFGAGLANSVSDKMREERELQQKYNLMTALEDHKLAAKRTAELRTLTQNLKTAYPDLTDDEIAPHIGKLMLAPDDTTKRRVLSSIEKQYKARTSGTVTSGNPSPLPGMGGGNGIVSTQEPGAVPDISFGATTGAKEYDPMKSATGQIDLSDQFNTPLPPQKAEDFVSWKSKLPKNLQSNYDYDLSGAFLAGVQPGPDGHMPDTFKKPNHPTFSVESRYSTAQNPGGTWTGPNRDQYQPAVTVTTQQDVRSAAPWTPYKNSEDSIFADEIDPAKNAKILEPLIQMRKDFMDGHMPQTFINEVDDAIATVNTIGDLGEAGRATALAIDYLNKKATAAGYNPGLAGQRASTAELIKTGIDKAIQSDRPDIAARFFKLGTQINTPGANFDMIGEQATSLMGQIPAVSFEEQTGRIQANNNVRRTNIEARKEQMAGIAMVAKAKADAGDYAGAEELGSQVGDYVAGVGQAPQVSKTDTDFVQPEETQRRLINIVRTLDPTVQVEADGLGGINLKDSDGEVLKGDTHEAAVALEQLSRYRQKKGTANKDPLLDGGDLATWWKSAFNTGEQTGTMEKSYGTGHESSYYEKIAKHYLGDLDLKREAPGFYRMLEKKILENTTDKAAAKRLIDKAKAEAKGTEYKAPENKPVSYNLDKVYPEENIDRENADLKMKAVASDEQKIEQEKAEGKPKRESVQEYATRLEKMDQHEAEAYMKYNPFKGDEEDLMEYMTASAKVANPDKAPDDETRRIVAGLNSSAREINELAEKKTSWKDIQTSSKTETLRQAAAEKRLRFIEGLNAERFAQFAELIDDPQLKKYFTNLYEQSRKASNTRTA